MKLKDFKDCKISRESLKKINGSDGVDEYWIPAYNPTTGQSHMIKCFGQASCDSAIAFWYGLGYVSPNNPNYKSVKI